MRMLWLSARKDTLRYLHDPLALATWIGIPLAILLVMALAFGGSDSPMPRGVLLVADEDGGLLSGMLQSSFQQGPMAKMFQVEKIASQEGRQRLMADKASAMLIIPPGFGDAVLANSPTRLTLVKNPAQRILPGIAEEMLVIVSEGAFYLHEVAGEPLQKLGRMQNAPADADVVALSLAFNKLATSLAPYLNPPRFQLVNEVREPEKKPAQFSFIQIMAPSLLFAGALFIARGQAGDHWDERDGATLRRIRASGGSLVAYLAGKLLATAVVFAVVYFFALPPAFFVAGLDWRLALTTWYWLVVAGLGLYGLMSLLMTLPSSRMSADILSMMVLFPLAMVGGGFFPLDMMPASIASIGRVTPLGWAIQSLTQAWTGASLLVPSLIALAFLALCLLAVYPRLRAMA